MKIIITEQQANEIVTSMLEDMFNGYEIKYVGDKRNVYVNGKLMAELGPTKGLVSADAYNELKDNLFFTSDKDLKRDVRDWVVNKFGTKGSLYGVAFKKLHGEEKPIAPPKRPRDPRGAEKGYDIQGFRERTKKIENRLQNKEDLIRLAKQKMDPDSFPNWWKRAEEKDIERKKKQKEEETLEKYIELAKKAKKK
jgi:hypothetical protein